MLPRLMIVVSFFLALASSANAQIAMAGFNDASGINSNPTINSPYNINNVSLNGQGVGEPGWASAWQIGGAPTIVNTGMFEGDGAARFQNTAVGFRVLQNPLAGIMSISLRFMISATGFSGNGINFYVNDTTDINQTGRVGPQWSARSNGHFYVLDGIEDGAVSPTLVDTGMLWTAGVYSEVGIEVNMVTRRWDFYVNGVKYNDPNQMGFRGNISQLDEVRWLNEVGAPNFSLLDAVVVVPEPSSLMLTGIGFLVAGRRVFRSIRGFCHNRRGQP